jgi:hypothetical protein
MPCVTTPMYDSFLLIDDGASADRPAISGSGGGPDASIRAEGGP